MNEKKYFYFTLILSVIVQSIIGIIDIAALFVKVESPYMIIRQLLILEVVVQAIEGLFYTWLVLNFNDVANVTPKRYIDWSITTPTMLVTLIIYLIYLKTKEEQKDTTKLELFNLISENSKHIINVVYLNWLMLIFGYLGEMKIISTFSGVLLGFIPFLIYYYITIFNFHN